MKASLDFYESVITKYVSPERAHWSAWCCWPLDSGESGQNVGIDAPTRLGTLRDPVPVTPCPCTWPGQVPLAHLHKSRGSPETQPPLRCLVLLYRDVGVIQRLSILGKKTKEHPTRRPTAASALGCPTYVHGICTRAWPLWS